MDKVLSARVDESVASKVSLLARQLRTSKKKVLEGAINMYAEKAAQEQKIDALDATFGAWQRDEPPAATVRKARDALTGSMTRHQR